MALFVRSSLVAAAHSIRATVIARVRSGAHTLATVRLNVLDRTGAVVALSHGTATIKLLHGPLGARVATRKVKLSHGTGLTKLLMPVTGTYTFKVTFGHFTTVFTVINGGRRQGA